MSEFRLRLHRALDDALVTLVKKRRGLPAAPEYVRVAGELADAAALYRSEGWLDSPADYHPAPPALTHPSTQRRFAHGLRYERISWVSGYAPHEGEPGRGRWASYGPNRTAHAYVLRHREPDRPWLVCLHGLGTGVAMADFAAFRARTLHRGYGFNLLFPVLPLHGPRKNSRFEVDEFLTFDLVDCIHGVAQAVWDVRQAISWIRGLGAGTIGVYGISLGGYVAALLATLEPDLDLVVAGAPVADIPSLYAEHAPVEVRDRAFADGVLGAPAAEAHRVISPLAAPPLVARRFLYGGLADGMSTIEQAQRLWSHWDEPPAAWYAGNHLAFMWNRDVREFVDGALGGLGRVS